MKARRKKKVVSMGLTNCAGDLVFDEALDDGVSVVVAVAAAAEKAVQA